MYICVYGFLNYHKNQHLCYINFNKETTHPIMCMDDNDDKPSTPQPGQMKYHAGLCLIPVAYQKQII